MVRFRPEIEPLVRLIEDSSREQVIDKVQAEIKSGRSYRELLAALFWLAFATFSHVRLLDSNFTAYWSCTRLIKQAWRQSTVSVGYRCCGDR